MRLRGSGGPTARHQTPPHPLRGTSGSNLHPQNPSELPPLAPRSQDRSTEMEVSDNLSFMVMQGVCRNHEIDRALSHNVARSCGPRVHSISGGISRRSGIREFTASFYSWLHIITLQHPFMCPAELIFRYECVAFVDNLISRNQGKRTKNHTSAQLPQTILCLQETS